MPASSTIFDSRSIIYHSGGHRARRLCLTRAAWRAAAKLVSTSTKKKGKRACLCFAVEGDHAWFYETESARRSIAHLNVSSNETMSTRALVAHDFESTRSEYRTWQERYRGQTKPGCYDTEDLHACRLAFLDDNISPSVCYSNGELVSLHVQLYKQHIYKTPRLALSLLRWSEELAHAGFDVPYRGENVAGYTHQVILALIKNRRKKVSRAERFKILEEHNHRCAQCGDLGNEFNNTLELDHPCPLRAGGDNQQPLIPLCSNCHSHKSYLECLTPFQENPLASVCEHSVYKSFHESPKPKQAVQQLHDPDSRATIEIDTVRCRRSALEHNQHPLPIFSPLDQVHQLDSCTLGDYCFVDKDVDILDPA